MNVKLSAFFGNEKVNVCIMKHRHEEKDQKINKYMVAKGIVIALMNRRSFAIFGQMLKRNMQMLKR